MLIINLGFSVFFFLKEWIMEQWEKDYYISAVAGIANGSSLVVMSKGWFLLSYIYWLMYFGNSPFCSPLT